MKAITLWQPWASLIFTGYKTFETRSWATFHQGPLAIHAAKALPPNSAWPQGDFDEFLTDEFGPHWGLELPRGVVLGTVDLLECKAVDAYDVDSIERLCGDWSAGRFAWKFTNYKKFDEPITASGHQQIWNWYEPPGVVVRSAQPALL